MSSTSSIPQKRVYRQGDVALIEMDSAPNVDQISREIMRGKIVLALGEVTGHSHALCGEVAEFAHVDGGRMVWVEAPSTIEHQEHGAIEILPGWYWVTQQREYSPEAIRSVVD